MRTPDATSVLFCPRPWDVEELTRGYVAGILNLTWRDLAEGAEDPTGERPECEMQTLVLGAFTAEHPDLPVHLCFNCAEILGNLDSCPRCGQLLVPVEHELVCAQCSGDP